MRGYQRWRDLAFFHWPVPAAELRPHVPSGLDIDSFEGNAYLGLVAFAMLGVRPRWLPGPLARDFLETNVRTYVHVQGRDPGVYFLSLDAASRLAVRVARALWGLPYFYAKMRLDKSGDRIAYGLERGGPGRPRLEARYVVGEALGPSEPGTLQHFLVERYLLHLERRGRLYTGQVHHTPYPVHLARLDAIDQTLLEAQGFHRPLGPPPLVHYSPGVDVLIYDLAQR